jgi:hypothetical protein
LPKLKGNFSEVSRKVKAVRNHTIQTQLRLAHVKEGEHEIRRICAEYADIFQLPGDRLTATSAIEHCIPTPTLPANRAIISRNYRIPTPAGGGR